MSSKHKLATSCTPHPRDWSHSRGMYPDQEFDTLGDTQPTEAHQPELDVCIDFFSPFWLLVMCCLNALVFPGFDLHGTSIFFIYLFVWQSIQESIVFPPTGGNWKQYSVRVHKGTAGEVSGSQINCPSPPAGAHLVPTWERLWVYFHLGNLRFRQEGIKWKLTSHHSHSLSRGQSGCSLKGVSSSPQ